MIVVKQRELIAVVWPALTVKHSERLFVWHRGLKALDGGKWRTRTYGTKSFVTPSASPCPSVPPPFRLNTKGAELFRTQTIFFFLHICCKWKRFSTQGHRGCFFFFFKGIMMSVEYYLVTCRRLSRYNSDLTVSCVLGSVGTGFWRGREICGIKKDSICGSAVLGLGNV